MTVIDIKDMKQDQSTIIEQHLRQIADMFDLSIQAVRNHESGIDEKPGTDNLPVSVIYVVNQRLI